MPKKFCLGRAEDNELMRLPVSALIWLMILIYGIQSYTCNPGLAFLPIASYLMDNLGFSAVQLAGFQAVVLAPWFLKPLLGLVADGVSLWGQRFKGYWLLCYSIVMVLFVGLSSVSTVSVQGLLLGLVGVSSAIALSDVLVDKLMVIEGNRTGTTQILQAAQWSSLGLIGAAMYWLGGWLADHASLSVVLGLSAIAPGLGLMIIASRFVEPTVHQAKPSLRMAWRALVGQLRSRASLMLISFIVLLGIRPIPPAYFYGKDVLNFSDTFVGSLGMVQLLGTGIGALTFGLLSRYISRPNLLKLILGFSALSTLSFIFLNDSRSALGVYFGIGAISIVATLGVFELATKLCPKQAEGTTYALIVAVSNLAQSLGVVFGSQLYDWGLSFTTLAILGAISTGLCVFWLPALQRLK
jgi:MFS family permease